MAITKKLIIPGAIMAASFLGAVGSWALATVPVNAATDSSTTAPMTAASTQPKDPSQGGHVGANGTKEVLLTGDTADKVKAAALAAVPGGTVQRAENDAEGSVYEAHMTKPDGTQVTVKVDASFNSTGVETGGPGGSRPQSQTN